MADRILVVAGEPSGDRVLAKVVRALGAPSIGIGGDALGAAGAELVAHVKDVSGMGAMELGSRVPAIARALLSLRNVVRDRKPRLALLASWSAANARIGARLRALGVRVVWISPPEVWAWRPGRARALASCADRIIPTLPFEEAIWREAGADARFVGHPALDDLLPKRSHPRRVLAVLPGSRPAEIERLVDPFLGAALRLDIDARVIVAPGLPPSARARVIEAASIARIETVDAPADRGASGLLRDFDVALVASGTASLECALAGVPPVVAYRLHPLTMAIAKRVVRVTHFALPNVVLARAGHEPVFRERLQEEVAPASLAAALAATLDDPRCARACASVGSALDPRLPGTFGERVARLC